MGDEDKDEKHLIEMQARQSMKLLYEFSLQDTFDSLLKLGILLWQREHQSFICICNHLVE